MMASSGKLQPPYILLSYFSLQQNNGKLKFPLPFYFPIYCPISFHPNQTQRYM